MRPSHELLFTVLKREDVIASATSWVRGRTAELGLSLNVISWFAVPVNAGWCLLSLWLARKQHALALAQRRELPEVAVTT